MEFLGWFEQLPTSIWLNESASIWAFPMFLFAHTLGMSIVAGGSAVISMALLGLWPKAPVQPLRRLYPVMLWGFGLNAFTGVAIFMKDARTYGSNPDFYVKLVFVFAGMVLLVRMKKEIFGGPPSDTLVVPPRAKVLAWASLLCWFCAIVAGRLIAYVGPVAGL